jgi:ubiquinone/menaquinone biosynthesis C-methylase UbiE
MEKHVCPWWMGYFLMSPLRRIHNDPVKIINPYVRDGMKVLEVGPGMGFFSIPIARGVGKSGRLYCVDVQEKMLRSLRRRAQKSGVAEIIETRLCPESSLQISDLAGKIDFILAFAVVHEVPSQDNLFVELYSVLKKDGSVLVAEPKKRVKEEDYNNSLAIARNSGFRIKDTPIISKNYSALLIK